MKRRSALAALACVWSAAGALAGAHKAASARAGVLAWGADGCWVDAGGDALQRLPQRLAPGIDPVATAAGLWLATAAGTLQCWAPDKDATWRLRCAAAFAEPVHALAASPDGRWALAAHGEQLGLLDARGEVARAYEGMDLSRAHRGAAAALFTLPRRRSFIATWPTLGELWEISLDPDAAPIFDGLVHDYRMAEAIAKPGYLGARRAPLGRPLPSFAFADERVPWLAGTLGDEVIVAHLDVRRRIATLPLPGADPAAAALRPASPGRGAIEWWLPAGRRVHVFDTLRWVSVAAHELPGPVRRLQATGRTLWALVGERDAATLFVLRDGPGEVWHAVRDVDGPLLSLCSHSSGTDLLVLRADPSALLRIGSDGMPLQSWPLPPGRWTGAAWRAAG